MHYDMESYLQRQRALGEIEYIARSISRWAIKAEALGPYSDNAQRVYTDMLLEDFGKLVTEMGLLRQAHTPASVQPDTRETTGVAA